MELQQFNHTAIRNNFILEFIDLLKKYNVEITASDHWTGYAECGQDIRMIVEFLDLNIEDIDLGSWITKDSYDNIKNSGQ